MLVLICPKCCNLSCHDICKPLIIVFFESQKSYVDIFDHIVLNYKKYKKYGNTFIGKKTILHMGAKLAYVVHQQASAKVNAHHHISMALHGSQPLGLGRHHKRKRARLFSIIVLAIGGKSFEWYNVTGLIGRQQVERRNVLKPAVTQYTFQTHTTMEGLDF